MIPYIATVVVLAGIGDEEGRPQELRQARYLKEER